MTDTDLTGVWARSLEALAHMQVQSSQLAWLRLARPMGLLGDTALIAAPNPFVKDYLENRLHPLVTQALSRELGRAIQLAVIVDPAPDPAAQPQTQQPQAQPPQPQQQPAEFDPGPGFDQGAGFDQGQVRNGSGPQLAQPAADPGPARPDFQPGPGGYLPTRGPADYSQQPSGGFQASTGRPDYTSRQDDFAGQQQDYPGQQTEYPVRQADYGAPHADYQPQHRREYPPAPEFQASHDFQSPQEYQSQDDFRAPRDSYRHGQDDYRPIMQEPIQNPQSGFSPDFTELVPDPPANQVQPPPLTDQHADPHRQGAPRGAAPRDQVAAQPGPPSGPQPAPMQRSASSAATQPPDTQPPPIQAPTTQQGSGVQQSNPHAPNMQAQPQTAQAPAQQAGTSHPATPPHGTPAHGTQAHSQQTHNTPPHGNPAHGSAPGHGRSNPSGHGTSPGLPRLAPARLNPKYTFETFVIGSSNRFAHAAAVAVAEAPAKAYNPLFVYGDSGLGKTHLLHAIGHYAQTLYSGLRVRYVSSEEFTNDFINMIRDGKQDGFRRRYRDVDVLLVDDIQFLENKEGTQEEFFHTFNTLHNANKQIVISSDRAPKRLVTLEDRLRSRFEWGLLTDVQPPELETRIAILRKKAIQEGLNAPADVLEYIASRISTNIRELEGALIRVTAFASLNRQTVDLQLAEIVLKDLMPEAQGPQITAPLIMGQTAAYFGLTIDDLCGSSRSRVLVTARHIAMYLCRELTDLSLPKIGQQFGGRDHTTVINADRKIRSLMAERRSIYTQVTELTNLIKQRARTG